MRLISIGGGAYRVSNADAGKLARAVGRKLPRSGNELSVVLPRGETAWLARTFHERKRIWYISLDHAERESELRHYTHPQPLRRAALKRAEEVIRYACQLEAKLAQGREGRWKARSIYHGQATRTRLRREAAAAYLVGADAYEEAGDLLLAMRYRIAAKKLLDERRFSGELERCRK